MTNNDKSKLTRRQNFCQLAFIIKTKMRLSQNGH